MSGLPPAKDLASVLGVNTNTVCEALPWRLRQEGLLEFTHGRGISVARNAGTRRRR